MVSQEPGDIEREKVEGVDSPSVPQIKTRFSCPVQSFNSSEGVKPRNSGGVHGQKAKLVESFLVRVEIWMIEPYHQCLAVFESSRIA